MVRLVCLVLALSLAALPARACRLALALAVDVSGSIDPGEYRFQMDGLADALDDPEVADALVLSQAAVMVVQWSGQRDQHISIPWRRMLSYDAVARFSNDVRQTQRRWHGGKTAVGEMMQFVLPEFARVSDCQRHVIDVSGDGATNDGGDTVGPRRSAQAAGVTVNGIAIDRIGASIAQYYKNFVIVGQGSFVLNARGYSDYPRAIRAKLLREIAVPAM